jgi:hypothetical protein
MSAAALLLLFLASDSQTLLDEVFQVPPAEWRYIPVVLKQPPVTVDADFMVLSSGGPVRVVLINHQDLDDLRQGDREALPKGAFERQGHFSRLVSVPDEYAVVIENGGRAAATVRLRVALDFSGRGRSEARYLSPQRRFAVILISASVFLAIVIYSARKLLAVIR